MTGYNGKFVRNQEKAIAALLSHPTIPGAAKSAGVSEATMWRWLQNKEFNKAFRDARHKLVSQAITRLQTGLTTAIDTLLAIAEDGEAPASSRVSAARIIIDQSFRVVEIEELEKRIEDLEMAIVKK